MRSMSCLLAGVLLTGVVGATEPPPWPAIPRDRVALDRLARARFDDARQLINGPLAPTIQPLAPGLDCRALYQQRVALSRQQLNYRPSFWEDPRSQTGVFIGAVWAPAFYYLPYQAFTEYRASARAPQVQADIDALRAASAQQRCFER